MKAFEGYKAQKQGGSREYLPAGGYVAQILDAKEVRYDWGGVLLISFDISEGERKGFFKKDYAENTNEDRKWRGTYRLNIPKDDGSEKDGWSKRTFGGVMWAVEESNPGYHWDWNEAGLKGKTVGVLFRNREWEMNGNSGWSTECCKMISAQDVRDGKFKIPKDKPLANKPADGFADITKDDDIKMPWDENPVL